MLHNMLDMEGNTIVVGDNVVFTKAGKSILGRGHVIAITAQSVRILPDDAEDCETCLRTSNQIFLIPDGSTNE